MLTDGKDHPEEKEEDSNEGEQKEDSLPGEEDREKDVPRRTLMTIMHNALALTDKEQEDEEDQ